MAEKHLGLAGDPAGGKRKEDDLKAKRKADDDHAGANGDSKPPGERKDRPGGAKSETGA